MEEEIVYKVLLLGDSSVGKTVLLNQYINNLFIPTNYEEIGILLLRINIKIL